MFQTCSHVNPRRAPFPWSWRRRCDRPTKRPRCSHWPKMLDKKSSEWQPLGTLFLSKRIQYHQYIPRHAKHLLRFGVFFSVCFCWGPNIPSSRRCECLVGCLGLICIHFSEGVVRCVITVLGCVLWSWCLELLVFFNDSWCIQPDGLKCQPDGLKSTSSALTFLWRKPRDPAFRKHMAMCGPMRNKPSCEPFNNWFLESTQYQSLPRFMFYSTFAWPFAFMSRICPLASLRAGAIWAIISMVNVGEQDVSSRKDLN